MNNGDKLCKQADALGLPYRTLADVTACLAEAKRFGTDKDMAQLLIKFGRMTADARKYVENYSA